MWSDYTVASAESCRAIGCVAYVEEGMSAPNTYKVSLRSLGDEDTTEIARAFGGGGHRNASSFLLSISDFNSWKE